MKSMRTIILLAVLVYFVESRARVKIVKQDGERKFRAIQGNPSEVVPQAVVVDTIDGSKQEQVSGPSQPQQFQVPLGERQPQEQFRAAQQGYQQGQQVQQFPQPQQQVQYQPQPNYQQQFPQQQPLQQFPQQQVYQPLPQSPFVPQQPQQITYQPQQQFQAGVPNNVIKQVMQTTPANSQLFAARYTTGEAGRPGVTLIDKLPSNSTRIRPNIVDGFSCQGRRYGYYADTLNECQIFHVCYPLKDVFENNPTVPDATYQFSFICNDFTRFSQDSLTCAWQFEAVPCEEAERLYEIVNGNFFKIPPPTSTGTGSSSGPAYQEDAPLPNSYPVQSR